jgi:hypothetical protein
MTGYQGKFRLGQLPVDHVKISPTHCARANTDQNLTGPRLGHWQLCLTQRLAGFFKKHRTHEVNVFRLALLLKPIIVNLNRFSAAAVDGNTMCLEELRSLFQEKRYAEVVALADQIQYPELMSESQRRMV